MRLPGLPDASQIRLHLGHMGQEFDGQRKIFQFLQKRVQQRILSEARGCGEEHLPRVFWRERLQLEGLPPAQMSWLLHATDGGHDMQFRECLQLLQERLSSVLVCPPGGLEIVEHEQGSRVTQLREKSLQRVGARLQPHCVNESRCQGVRGRTGLATDKIAARSKTLDHTGLMESRAGHGTLANASRAQERNRTGLVRQ